MVGIWLFGNVKVQAHINGKPAMTIAKLTSDSHIIGVMFVSGVEVEGVCNIGVPAI